MERALKLVGKTSNEIFIMRYPTTLLDFCESDFTYFVEHSIELCSEGLKTGDLDLDRMAELRREIQGAHCYIEHNIRTVYEKIVLDCWIDYLCRRDNVGLNVLWNRFIRCHTDFEKAVFARLCDFRYNRAINEWQNIIRVQDYARCKVDFIFPPSLDNVEDAVARRNYFDLAFSVTAREMGCRLEDLGVTKTFSVGRVPTSPFLFPNISKDIVRNLLTDYDYSDDYSDVGDYSGISDKIAMDAFSRLKAGLPLALGSYSVPRGKMDQFGEKLYMPCSLKAAVDLEIDAMLENGEWLGRCKRCGRYFLMDNNNKTGYCARYSRTGGKTCLEIYQEEHPKPDITPQLEQKCREVTNAVYSRVDKTMSVKEYEYWYNYLEAMKQKVKNGEISPEELNDFLNYSLSVDITKSSPIVEVPKREPVEQRPSRERVVKPFVPERISREQMPRPEYNEEEQRVLKEGFFTSPTVQRKKSEKPQISHIIRNGESLGGDEAQNARPDPAGFRPFGAPEPPAPAPRPMPAPHHQQEQSYNAPSFDAPAPETPAYKQPEQRDMRDMRDQREQREHREQWEQREPVEQTERRSPYYEIRMLEERLEEEKRRRSERAGSAARSGREEPAQTFVEDIPERIARARSEQPFEPEPEPPFPLYDEVPEGRRRHGTRIAEQRREEEAESGLRDDAAENTRREEPERTETRPKVIRKNAAAISAYGKAAGAPVLTMAEEAAEHSRSRQSKSAQPSQPAQLSQPAQTSKSAQSSLQERSAEQAEPAQPTQPTQSSRSAKPAPSIRQNSRRPAEAPQERFERVIESEPADSEPFRDIERIFDVLEQQEDEARPRRRETPRITKENAPAGIWTEDRDLFDEPYDETIFGDEPSDEPGEPSELDVLRSRKHSKTNKTRRLYDVIMREPDDNPNFRKK